MTDQLCSCRKCSSHLCYELHDEFIVHFRCMSCGFQTNTLLLNGTESVKSFEKQLPSLYKDIKYEDTEGFTWYPTVMNLVEQGLGILFADGSTASSWFWAVAKAVEVEPHEKERFKNPQTGDYMKYKASTDVVHFDQDKFAIALQYLGVI